MIDLYYPTFATVDPRVVSKYLQPTGNDIGAEAILISALEDERYRWRTVEALSLELGLPESQIRRLINDLIRQGVVVTSSIPSPDGRPLFTTRHHLKRKSSIIQRLAAAFRNRAD
jgi:predicted transcriptional regulator